MPLEYDQIFISYAEYMNIYRALLGDLEESVKKKQQLIKRYEQEIKDLNKRIESIKIAHDRAKEEK